MKSFSEFLENPQAVLNEGITDYTEEEKKIIWHWLEFSLRGIENICKTNGVGTHAQWNPIQFDTNYNGPGVRSELTVKWFGSRVGEWGLTPVAKKAITEAFKLGKTRLKGVELDYDTAEKDWVHFNATLSDDKIKKLLKERKVEQAKTMQGVERAVIDELLKKYPDMNWARDRITPAAYEEAMMIRSAGNWHWKFANMKSWYTTKVKFEQDLRKAIVKVRDSSKLNPGGWDIVLVQVPGNASFGFKARTKPKS